MTAGQSVVIGTLAAFCIILGAALFFRPEYMAKKSDTMGPEWMRGIGKVSANQATPPWRMRVSGGIVLLCGIVAAATIFLSR